MVVTRFVSSMPPVDIHSLIHIKIHHNILATLWLFNIAMENVPFIDGLPIKNGWIFHGELLNNQMVHLFTW
jgi:hypothetical protein